MSSREKSTHAGGDQKGCKMDVDERRPLTGWKSAVWSTSMVNVENIKIIFIFLEFKFTFFIFINVDHQR